MIKKKTKIYTLLSGVLLIGVISGIILTVNFNLTSKAEGQSKSKFIFTKSNRKTSPALDILKQMNQGMKEIIATTKPSVVSIEVNGKIKPNENPDEEMSGGEEEQAFPFFFYKNPQKNRGQIPINAAGSGVIISSNGYILTNNHVINLTKDKDVEKTNFKINVILDDQREFQAKIIGSDPLTDIAVLKIDATDLPAIDIGDSDELEVGEFVFAIGNPFRLQSTVTSGIVSAKGRNINIIGDSYGVEYFIQTDAAINSGNSGGALINVEGKLIGINTAIASKTGTYEGYGFAVPINIAKSVVEDIVENGKVRRGYMGVSIRALDATTAKAIGLKEIRGVLVENALENSSAAAAGIKAGDVILEVDGKKVKQANEVQSLIVQKRPEQTVLLTIWRDGNTKTIPVVLKERNKGEGDKKLSAATSNEKYNEDRLGIDVADLNPKEMEKAKVNSGIKVINVEMDSEAMKRGIAKGDIIFEIDRISVKSAKDFSDKLKKKKAGDSILLRIKRNDNTSFVAIEIPTS